VNDTLYHIYAKDRCLYNCLNKEEFDEKWKMLNNMVGVMKTDYTAADLSYEKLGPTVGGHGSVIYPEPSGGDSY